MWRFAVLSWTGAWLVASRQSLGSSTQPGCRHSCSVAAAATHASAWFTGRRHHRRLRWTFVFRRNSVVAVRLELTHRPSQQCLWVCISTRIQRLWLFAVALLYKSTVLFVYTEVPAITEHAVRWTCPSASDYSSSGTLVTPLREGRLYGDVPDGQCVKNGKSQKVACIVQSFRKTLINVIAEISFVEVLNL